MLQQKQVIEQLRQGTCDALMRLQREQAPLLCCLLSLQGPSGVERLHATELEHYGAPMHVEG